MRVPTGASMQSAMNIHCDVIFGSGRESISDFVPTFSRSHCEQLEKRSTRVSAKKIAFSVI